ncbi:hypothetical protein [Ohtaekwangia sp.]|uniref:hypothetical protein n=1 Tax=Ohtaekwangia sp. TaxID=2066019 RepID=UPI002FDCA367
MGTRILIFNVIYYSIILFLINLGWNDPSSSLGYGYFILFFWIVAGIVLAALLYTKVLQPESTLEKIGIFTATPVVCIVIVWLILALK